MSIRRSMYQAARLLGDIQAIRKGPKAIVKREVRRVVYRNVNKQVGRFLRKTGMM